ncbi:MAG: hypothetical protein FWC16_02300 [Defluviitaleaceae bacterium]|nr:hypothetical protein [Defluviitaleaceae bacterium]MCL2273731.1 hypothetical protein [Defluviitaleaceae bacterium]
MLKKQLKYDFLFGARIFLGMGGVLMGIGVIGWLLTIILSTPNQPAGNDAASLAFGLAQFYSLGITAAVVVSVVQLFHMYNRQCFGDYGHLMLTLPVGRGTLLVSKYIVAFFWVVFMFATMVLSMYIMTNNLPHSEFNFMTLPDGTQPVGLGLIGPIALLTSTLFAGITITFLLSTLMNSTIGGWRIHKSIALVIWAAVVSGFIIMAVQFNGRYRVWATREVTHEFTIDGSTRIGFHNFLDYIVGWDVGRIPLGNAFIDIFYVGAMLAFSLIIAGITYWLLRSKVSV